MALNHLDADLVGAFDESVFDLTAGDRFYLVSDPGPIFSELLESLFKIGQADTDMVDRMAFGRLKLGLPFPLIGLGLLRVFNRKDDDVHIIEH